MEKNMNIRSHFQASPPLGISSNTFKQVLLKVHSLLSCGNDDAASSGSAFYNVHIRSQLTLPQNYELNHQSIQNILKRI